VASLLAAPLVGALASEPGCHLNSGCGFPAPGTDIFEFAPYVTFHFLGIDWSITKATILVVIGVVAIVGFFLIAFARPRLVPGRTQNVGEVGYLFIRDQIAREIIGKEGDRYVPFLASLFFFVWVMNLFGVFALAQFPVTARFAFPVALAIMVWLTYMFLGMKKQGPIGFFKNMMFPPGLPVWLYFILAPIELISNVIVRPFTLAVRAFANMFAGHLLLTTFTVATWYLLSPSLIGIIGSAASFVVTVILTAFELLIQALQAFIFTLLTAVYISTSLHAEH
jgi:F-type H+-transporting ATPase subunit a